MPDKVPAPAPTVTYNAAAHRFECHVDGLLCELTCELVGGVMHLNHTGVPSPLEGRGLAAALVRAAFDHARASQLRVRPLCSYVQTYLRRHPEAQDLLEV